MNAHHAQRRRLKLEAGLLATVAAVAVLTVTIGAGIGDAAGTHINWNASAATSQKSGTTASVDQARTLSHAFRAASERVLPAVVTIQSMPGDITATTPADQRNNNVPDELRNNPFFKRFFDELPETSPRDGLQPQRQGMGSGIIVDPSGTILTNNHVVNGAGKLIVRMHDGREFEAKEWKTDPKTDIAVVRIDTGSALPAATIGNSDTLDIGDWVMAIGAPFGLNETVTAGIISAKSRGIGIADREEFLQTDAAINPGNSGGPLVNLNGEVVGINTAISSTSGGYQGIGFAIPINLARWVGDELVAHGTVQRAFLGVGIQSVTDTLSKQFGLKTVEGAVVTNIRPDSPAAKSGLQSGDVIVEFDGKAIGSPRVLQGAVERASIGDAHKLIVVRDGKRVSLAVSVAAMPTDLRVSMDGRSHHGPSQATPEFNEYGISVADLTADVASQLGMESAEGVVITRVRPDSPAARAGLSDGVVITQVSRMAVKNLEDFRTAMKSVTLKDGVLLLVRSENASRFVVVKE